MKYSFQEGLAYVSGSYVPSSQAMVPVYDSALMYGDMVFEFTRSFNHKPFRLREHLERLYASIKICRIDPGISIGEMEEKTLELVEKNLRLYPPEMDFQIVHDVSRGILGPYRRMFGGNDAPCVVIFLYPLDLHLAALAPQYKTGIHLVIPRQQSIPARYLDPKMKNRSRLFYKMAEFQAKDVRPDAWALLTDEDGFLTESTGANVFLFKDGVLLTPEPRNILRGVSRHTVMDLAEELSIPCSERNLEPYDVYTADEVFLTSTPFCLLPAVSVDGHTIGTGIPGPLANQLLDAWGEKVGVDIPGQAAAYAELAREYSGKGHDG